jgi:hypothetical protein
VIGHRGVAGRAQGPLPVVTVSVIVTGIVIVETSVTVVGTMFVSVRVSVTV